MPAAQVGRSVAFMRVVLITGTSTGIGRACAARLAGEDWTVFAGVRRSEDADQLEAELSGDVRPVILDVCDRDQMREVMVRITADIGETGLDGLVNNAGVGVGAPVEYSSEQDWRWVFDVNLFSIVALTQAATPLLRRARGRVVYIGSIGGRLSTPGQAAYSASKHALEALAEAQRHEFRRAATGIKVSLVEPGEVKTAIWEKATQPSTSSSAPWTMTAAPATDGSSISRAVSSTRVGIEVSMPTKSLRPSNTA
jgi:NAD(P)-dependent dehydrogenase (short-subunit alcohol dehydrogenase family)